MVRITLLAHNIRSLWNVGSFFRTADAFGVKEIWLSGYTGKPPRREISKTALGAENWVPWRYVEDSAEAMKEFASAGGRIVALEQTSRAIDIAQYKVPATDLLLVLGNEVRGVSEDLLKLCDDHVQIPMQGKKQSLNVSVAAGVALYALTKPHL